MAFLLFLRHLVSFTYNHFTTLSVLSQAFSDILCILRLFCVFFNAIMTQGGVFVSKLKKIREELKITQKELAEKLGVSRAQVANIEQGIRVITPRMERDLISHLNVNPEWLNSGIEPIFADKYSDFDLDTDEKEFIELYDSLDKESKKLIVETMKRIVSK